MNSSIELNYPEMHGDTCATIQAEYVALLQKYRVKCKDPIPVKRGITQDGQIGTIGANGVPNKRAGWYRYYMTEKAFTAFSLENKITLNCLLD